MSTSYATGDVFDAWLDGSMPPPETWPGPYPEEWQEAMREAGATISPLKMRLVLDGTAARAATITQARAVKEECSEPAPAAHFTVVSEGEAAAVGWAFDLAARDAVALDESGRPYFEDTTISLAPGEVIPIDVRAEPGNQDCRWRLALDVVVGTDERTIVVDDEGDPFHTSPGDPGVRTHSLMATGDGIAGPDGIDGQVRVGPTAEPPFDIADAEHVYDWDGTSWTEAGQDT